MLFSLAARPPLNRTTLRSGDGGWANKVKACFSNGCYFHSPRTPAFWFRHSPPNTESFTHAQANTNISTHPRTPCKLKSAHSPHHGATTRSTGNRFNLQWSHSSLKHLRPTTVSRAFISSAFPTDSDQQRTTPPLSPRRVGLDAHRRRASPPCCRRASPPRFLAPRPAKEAALVTAHHENDSLHSGTS